MFHKCAVDTSLHVRRRGTWSLEGPSTEGRYIDSNSQAMSRGGPFGRGQTGEFQKTHTLMDSVATSTNRWATRQTRAPINTHRRGGGGGRLLGGATRCDGKEVTFRGLGVALKRRRSAGCSAGDRIFVHFWVCFTNSSKNALHFLCFPSFPFIFIFFYIFISLFILLLLLFRYFLFIFTSFWGESNLGDFLGQLSQLHSFSTSYYSNLCNSRLFWDTFAF